MCIRDSWFDGSDVGLSTSSSEDLDAISLAPDGSMVSLSTLGSFAVTGLSGNDEDLFDFEPTSLGGSTAGSFSIYFNGLENGLEANDDLIAAWEF